MLKTMVAFIKKRIRKSTISAINLWAKDGITYSLPVNEKRKVRKTNHFTQALEPKLGKQMENVKSRYNSLTKCACARAHTHTHTHTHKTLQQHVHSLHPQYMLLKYSNTIPL